MNHGHLRLIERAGLTPEAAAEAIKAVELAYKTGNDVYIERVPNVSIKSEGKFYRFRLSGAQENLYAVISEQGRVVTVFNQKMYSSRRKELKAKKTKRSYIRRSF